MEFSSYTSQGVKEVLARLKTRASGLSDKEAEERLKIYGLNEVKAKEAGLLGIFLRQLKSPFFYLLFIAAVVAFLIGEKIDGFLILVFILINTSLGFFQEAKAERTMSLLKRYVPLSTKVLREGKERTIEKRFLAPGDIVLLGAGDVPPADLRILKAQNFLVDESVLTGESQPVPKTSRSLSKEAKEIFEAKNVVFASTSVVSGQAKGVVVGTGKTTVFGQIAKLVSGISRESVYEKNLLAFCQLVLRIVVITIIAVLLSNLIIKGKANFSEFLIFSIALVVSIIPEALPLVTTFALSQGALRLAKEKVVVKRLSAIEDLGDIEVLCADKTGTLTENKLSLEETFSFDKEKCLLYGLLSSSSSPFDLALRSCAPPKIRQSLKKFRLILEIPFDPFRLRTSVLVEDYKGNRVLITKGAPEKILKLSANFGGKKNLEEIRKEIEKRGKEGKRVLALAYKRVNKSSYSTKDENDLIFLGYFSFVDPLKKTAKETVKLAKKLGLKIKVLTGDSKEVAGQIGKEIDLIKDPQEVILGERLDSLSEEDFEKACFQFSVFARVSPTTKFKIIQALQIKYEVGFLGEGINDAPALKIANVALAVPKATDVCREASDIILLKKDLRVVVNGIKEGRGIFSNINKYIKCTLSSNFGNFYSIAAISLFIPFLPMLPVQILLVNLLSDFPLVAVATDKVDVEELKKPKLYQLNQVIFLVMSLALVSTIYDLLFFGIFHKVQPSLLQTLWFIESILTEIALIFSIRTRHLFFRTKVPSLPLIVLSFLAVVVTVWLPFAGFGKDFFHFVTPPLSALLITLSLIFSYFIVSEIVKLIYFRQKSFAHLTQD